MSDHAQLVAMLSDYGLWALTPLAVIEGPIVSVVAGYLASLSILRLWHVVPCVILADIVGDSLMYLLGRGALNGLSRSWRDRLGLSEQRIESLTRGFHNNSTKILVTAKLTHAAGFAALAAAGAAHMRFVDFLVVNTLAGIPKCLFFVALGYLFGSAYETIDGWISLEAGLLLIVGLAVGLGVYVHRRRVGK